MWCKLKTARQKVIFLYLSEQGGVESFKLWRFMTDIPEETMVISCRVENGMSHRTGKRYSVTLIRAI